MNNHDIDSETKYKAAAIVKNENNAIRTGSINPCRRIMLIITCIFKLNDEG